MSFSVRISPEWFLLDRLPGSGGVLPLDNVSAGIVVDVFPHWYSHASISWSIPSDWGNCVFHVYSKQGDEVTRLTENAVSGPFFKDMSLRETSKFHNLEYIVEAILLDKGNTTRRSKPRSWEYRRRSWVELRSNEVQRREFMLLSKFAGVKTYLFKRRIYGERCHRCWNHQTELVVDDHCPICYGTSFTDGFFDPTPLFVQFDSSPNDRQKSYIGNVEPNQIGAWTISVPRMDPDDILIRTGDWSAYRVSRITPTELQTVVVRQIMTLTQLSKNDVEYQLMNRIETAGGSSCVAEAFPKTPPRPSPVRGQQDRFPAENLEDTRKNPEWLQEMDQQSIPVKYSL